MDSYSITYELVENTDLKAICQMAPVLLSDTSLEEASELLNELKLDYLAVAHDGEIIGICSRLSMGTLLGRRYGIAVLGRSRVKEFMEDQETVVRLNQPLVEIFNLALTRSHEFFSHDVVALNSEGEYVGLIKSSSLARLQNKLVEEKVDHLKNRKVELENANKRLREMADQLRDSNRELELARDQGLQAARAKSEFLAVMSHEIRTPLNGVIGMLNLLGYSNLNEEQDELAKTAMESSEALLLILNDILDFSRLDSGGIELEQHDFDIRDLAESVISLMAESAHESRVGIYSDVSLDIPQLIKGDSSRLRQVIANLVGNAVKFTSSGEVCLRIFSLHSETKENGGIRIEVSDTGIGISKESQLRLFQPFAQADSSTTRQFGGTGLGLAICQKLVTAMGSCIELKSDLGKGSTFGFDLFLDEPLASFPSYDPKKVDRPLQGIVALKNPRENKILSRELIARGLHIVECDSDEMLLKLIQVDSRFEQIIFGEERLLEMSETFLKFDLPTVLLRPSHSCPRDDPDEGIAFIRRPLRSNLLDRALGRVLNYQTQSGVSTNEKDEGMCHSDDLFTENDLPRLLLVEDHHINRRLIVKMLDKFGYECDIAEDGIEAFEICKRQSYPIILLDCQMPRMDGYEFSRLLRLLESDDPDRDASHVIALTANAMAGDRELCFSAGMNDYLSKPIDRDDLQLAIKRGLALGCAKGRF